MINTAGIVVLYKQNITHNLHCSYISLEENDRLEEDREEVSDYEDSDWHEQYKEDLLSDINDDGKEQFSDIISHEDSVISSASWGTACSSSAERFIDSTLLLQETATKGTMSLLMIPPKVTYIGEREGEGISPPLTPSLFPTFLQPTIHFPLPHEKCKNNMS